MGEGEAERVGERDREPESGILSVGRQLVSRVIAELI